MRNKLILALLLALIPTVIFASTFDNTGTLIHAITAASGAVVDGAIATLGTKADAKNTATDTTSLTIMQVLKEISAMEQAPASRAVTNAGTFPTQSAVTAASGSVASGAFASGSIASGALASGSVASGAIAAGAVASGSVVDGAVVTLGTKADAKSTATDTTSISIMSVLKQVSASIQSLASGVTQSGVWTVQPGNTANTTAWKVDGSAVTQPVSIATAPALVASSAVIGKVGIDQTTPGTTNAVQPIPATSGGLTLSSTISAASTNATNIKNGAGQVYMISIQNTSATAKYVRFFNLATTPTVGTSTPVLRFLIPASGGNNVPIPDTGIAFGTGIAFDITGAAADNDTTAVAASDVFVNVGYK